MTTFLYDGSYEGFLTAVFEVYHQKRTDVRIRKQVSGALGLWGETVVVETDMEKSTRVWEGMKKKISEEASRHFYANYLSELTDEEDNMLAYIRYVFASKEDISSDLSTPSVLRVSKVAKMVGREKHRMEAFVRFQLTEKDIWYATVEPDFNVLPLIIKHFKSRYADQKWLIADVKRDYGIYYDLEKTHILYGEILEKITPLNETEKAYQRLWKAYFKSTNIVERKNMKLHVQHIPLRYWKYLSEKQP
jgi:probable DNA metabolism protein